MASKFTDADGCHPKHTFFFPAEEYVSEHLDGLAELCAKNFGEIEVHLHHDNDTSDNLSTTLTEYAEKIHQQHGALSRDPATGNLRYAFIHGNWALDNSGEDGRWCGVNDEISVLCNTGCYADFTFPCAPHPSQPRQINSIYYAVDDPEKPKSHDTGIVAAVGKTKARDLLMVTGPLLLNWRKRKFGILPHIENSDIRASNPPIPARVDYWIEAGIHVKSKPEWIFVKVHTHGAPEREADTLLGAPIEQMHRHLQDHYNDGKNYSLHYVSAREMYNIIRAAEHGESGDPGQFRDYELPRPWFSAGDSSE